MKPDSVFKKAFNRTLQLLDEGAVDISATSENALRARIGVSRTTVRKVLGELQARGIIRISEDGATVGRNILKSDYFPDLETTSKRQHVEEQFMEWMLRGDTQPGTLINELQLARQFGVATNGVREFLIRFSRFGLIEKSRILAGCSRDSPRLSRSNSSRSASCSNCARLTFSPSFRTTRHCGGNLPT